MKLSFSTRGWQGFSWDEMLETAIDMGFAGVEVYNLHSSDDLTDRGCPFHKYNTAATVRAMREKQLSIPCFDTSYDISADKAVAESVKALMDVAYNAHVPYVVVCALQDDEDTVYSVLSDLVPYAESIDVSLLVKTSGIYSDTARL